MITLLINTIAFNYSNAPVAMTSVIHHTDPVNANLIRCSADRHNIKSRAIVNKGEKSYTEIEIIELANDN